MPVDDVHEVKFYVSDDWCGATVCANNTIHVCNDEPGHLYQHQCSHGGACGYTWIETNGLPQWVLRGKVVFANGKAIGII